MKHFFKIASAFLLLACTSIALQAQTKTTDESWELAKKQAVSEHKLILIDLYFTGCVPCARMDEDVFPDPKVVSLLKTNFVIFKSDILKEEIGKKLCMQYGVTGFPTFVLMNADGKIIDIASGFQSVEQFTSLLEKAKANAQKGNFKKYSTQELDYPDFYRQAYMANKRNIPFEVFDTYLKSQPSLLSEVPFVIITGLRVGGVYDDFFLKNVKTLANDYGTSSVNGHVFTILGKKKKEFEKTNDLSSFKKLMDEMKPVFSADEWSRYEPALLKNFGVVVAPATNH